MGKKVLKSPGFLAFLGLLVATYCRGIAWFCRWKTEGAEHIAPYLVGSHPVIVVFWHARMMLAPFAWKSRVPFFMLISPHSNGKLISRIVGYFGIQSVFGSSSHGRGAMALRHLLRCLRSGHCIGMTPDGPRGPREHLKEGVFMLSYASQCPVIALSFSTSCHKKIRSWDRFLLPFPSFRGYFVWSVPIAAPTMMQQKEGFLEQVQGALDGVTKRSDHLAA
jgi:lysophospholipid acyltransferase (LPLAT)-like uncharacterized protein